MTAINLIVQRDAAHIITDGCIYDDDAVIRWIGSKAMVSDELRMAIVPSGRCSAAQLFGAIGETPWADQDAVLLALAAAADSLALENERQCPGMENGIQVYVAMWSIERQRPEGWMLSTCPLAHWGNDYIPGTFIPVDAMVGTVRPPAVILGRAVDLSDPGSFDARVDGLALMEEQRRTPWSDGTYCVGGHAELLSVSADRVGQEILTRWPDRIGERIAIFKRTAGVFAPAVTMPTSPPSPC